MTEDVLRALRESEQRYRSLFEALPLPTLSWKRVGEEFVCQEVNEACSRFTGGRERQLLGHSASELWPEEPELLEEFARCWRDRATFRRELLHTLRTTGERKWLGLTFAFAPPDLIVTQVEDQTERRRFEESLARSEREYRTLFEEASDCIFVLDDDGAVLDVNHRVCEMVGLPREKLLGLQARAHLLPDSEGRSSESVSLGLGVGGHVTVERRISRSDGTAFDAELSVRRIEPGRVLAIGRDISDRKRAKSELRQLSAKLLQLQDEERRRIARELHDSTGQVLTGLALTLDALVRTADLDEPTRRALDKAKALAEQCTRDIRTLSYLLHPPMLEEAGLSAALEWLVEGFAERSGIATHFSMTQEDERLPHDVELALFRVVQEGLTNVHRHS